MVLPNEEPKKSRKPEKPAKPNKSQERSLVVPVPASSAGLSLLNPDAAGIDVHSNMHMVCVPADRDANPVRQFGANTADLQEIAAWLKKCGVKTVALESTGVYWIPLFELLESEGFEVHLVEPGQLSRCGRAPRRTCSTPVDPAVALLRSLACIVSAAGFRAGAACLLAATADAGAYAASHVQHMQKALEQMNVKLTEVVTDITGLTGMSIIDAILEGNATPSNWPNCGMNAVITARTRSPSRCKERGGPTSLRASAGVRLVPVPPSTDHRVRPAGPSGTGEVRRTGRERKLGPASRASVGAKAMTSGSRRRARCSRHWAWT